MRPEVLVICLIAGGLTWAFRFLPTRADLGRLPPGGVVARLLTALGPAAIAALFAAELRQDLARPLTEQGPLMTGIGMVLASYLVSRSVVGATLAGAAGFGLAVALGL